MIRVPIHLKELHGLRRSRHPVRVSVPLPAGRVPASANTSLYDREGRQIPHQTRSLATWIDGSAKWMLLDFQADLDPHERTALTLTAGDDISSTPPQVGLEVSQNAGSIEIDTYVTRFAVPGDGHALLTTQILSSGDGCVLRLVDDSGQAHLGQITSGRLEEAGPIRAGIRLEGRFGEAARGDPPLRFVARLAFFAGCADVKLEVTVHNTLAAIHAGNCWDLGDRGSIYLRELSIDLRPSAAARSLTWYTDSRAEAQTRATADWHLYQDSSGGDYWNSTNHIDANGSPTVSFRGYRVCADGENISSDGNRAQPGLLLDTAAGPVGVTVERFWQNFPKALRWRKGTVSIELFPSGTAAPLELQGGEKKRHTTWLALGVSNDLDRLRALQQPVSAYVDPDWVDASGAVAIFTARNDDERCSNYIRSIIEGPLAFDKRREVIDEYGWRNFGDLYADHEAVGWDGSKPLVSHYNNQYDFIYAACTHFLRSGDERWRELMTSAAHHNIDIDIYHTDADRSAYSGGLFWHTDHYLDAATSTHRTYSAKNGQAGVYGGGPSDEHNYTSGLLLYYYLTGDPEARLAVIGLADWVMRMDDGKRSLLALFDTRPTGLASRTVSDDYHKPGRGSGNSINALLDAYTVSLDRTYLLKAEELIRRCIHPRDQLAALRLDEPEYRWSYLVFLQVLGKYLYLKRDLKETDFAFYYARDSLLHYADWMLENEKPYADILHKVKLPTETWPAQDIRKCHVFHLAARCSTGERRAVFAERASYYYDRCLSDLLAFKTAYLTRPRVIIAVYGPVQTYFMTHGYEGPEDDPFVRATAHLFGSPQPFSPQRIGLAQELRARWRASSRELWRLVRSRLTSLLTTRLIPKNR